MRVCIVDTETTGLEVDKGHRIIEIAMHNYSLETEVLVDSYVARINPLRPIDPGAEAVHGISLSDLLTEPTWEDVAPAVQSMLARCDTVVAHNADFDIPFVAVELMRVGLEVPNIETFCTMLNARWATPLGKSPSLKELAFALRVPYDPSKAHGASYDVEVTAACLFEGIRRGFYKLPGMVTA